MDDFALRNVIYLATCSVNGKGYVGQTRQSFGQRKREHRLCAEGKPSHTYHQKTAIARAMRKHGFSAFTFEILEVCGPDQLDEREAYWIVKLGTLVPHGYNLSAGGRNAPRAPQVGAQISRANKGREKTPEWRAALSLSHTGKTLSPEHRAKISAIQRGKTQSAESNSKRSKTLLRDLTGQRFGRLTVLRRGENYLNPALGKGLPQWICQCDCGTEKTIRSAHLIGGNTSSCGCKARDPRSEESNAKRRSAMLGRRLSEDHKAKVSAAQKGKKRGPYSEEHRAAIRAGHTPEGLERSRLAAIGRRPSAETLAKRRLSLMKTLAKKKGAA